MSQKKIQINPAFFSVKNNKTQRASGGGRPRKQKPRATLKPTKLKKQLLGRIKEHQKRRESDNKLRQENERNDEFESEFEKSLGYLQEITKNKNKSRKNKSSYIDKNKVDVSLELPPELNSNGIAPITSDSPILQLNQKQDVPYGCLKGGSKPTYRQWMQKTQRNHHGLNVITPPKVVPKISPEIKVNPVSEPLSIIPNPVPVTTSEVNISEREKNLNMLKEEHKRKKRPFKTKITKTLRYKLGKKNNKVGILIKDRNTRKRVQEEHTLLKKKSIMEIKNYLKERNLIKVGSEAPNDVVRHMYEQAVLCGDVENMSKDALVHNFLNDA